MNVMGDGRPATGGVTSDGAGLVSHAGTALVAQVADKVGLTNALSARLAPVKQRRRGHDPGRVIRWAHASARARSWELHGASEWLTLDVDATLIAAHSARPRSSWTTRCSGATIA